MYTVLLRNYILKGSHGINEREQSRVQRFVFNLKMDVLDTNISSDDILQVYDYRLAKNIIAKVFCSRTWCLIDSMAQAIVDQLITDPRVIRLRLEISKPDVWQDCTPGVVIRRESSPYDNFYNVSIEPIYDQLRKYGAISLPFLKNSYREMLANRAQELEYKKLPEYIHSSTVEQHISVAGNFSDDSPFTKLKREISDILQHAFRNLKLSAFTPNLCFNEAILQRYDGGDIGISPHRDGASRINLIAIIILDGNATFGLCEDRTGNNPRYLDTKEGNIILLRAPGFLGSDYQPFHFVSNVSPGRTIFSLRQRTT